MRKGIIIVGLILFYSFQSLLGQDIILLRTGEEIRAKITEVTSTEIKYKRFDNLDGPNYITSKSEIFMITYENGRKEVFDQQPEAQPSANIQQGVDDYNLWLKKTKGAKTMGFIIPAGIALFGIPASLSDDDVDGPILGGIALLIAGVGIPIVAGKSRRAREATGVDGVPGYRTSGWIIYGLSLVNGMVLIAAGAAEQGLPSSYGIITVITGSVSSILFALDASETNHQISRSFSSRLKPFYDVRRDFTSKNYHVVGVKLMLH